MEKAEFVEDKVKEFELDCECYDAMYLFDLFQEALFAELIGVAEEDRADVAYDLLVEYQDNLKAFIGRV